MLGRMRTDDRGFTLLEVISTCLLLGILLGLAIGPWQSYRAARAHIEARNELVATLRHAQISSVAEAVTYRVDITDTTAVTYRVVGGVGTEKRRFEIDHPSVRFSAPAFEDTAGATVTSAFFYPKGSASRGSVDVVRDGRSKVYTVSVEGLTARVSFTG